MLGLRGIDLVTRFSGAPAAGILLKMDLLLTVRRFCENTLIYSRRFAADYCVIADLFNFLASAMSVFIRCDCFAISDEFIGDANELPPIAPVPVTPFADASRSRIVDTCGLFVRDSRRLRVLMWSLRRNVTWMDRRDRLRWWFWECSKWSCVEARRGKPTWMQVFLSSTRYSFGSSRCSRLNNLYLSWCGMFCLINSVLLWFLTSFWLSGKVEVYLIKPLLVSVSFFSCS